jgi:hypothetical protein
MPRWVQRLLRSWVLWLAMLVPVILLASSTVGLPSRHERVTSLNPDSPGQQPSGGAQRFVLVSSMTSQAARSVTVAAGASVPVRLTGGRIPAVGVSALAVHVSVTASAQRGSAKSSGGTVLVAPWAPPAPRGTGGGRALAAGMASERGAAPAPSAHLVAYRAGAISDGFALVGVGAAGALLVSNQGALPVTVGLAVQGYLAVPGSAADGGAVVPLSTPHAVASDHQMGAGQTTWLMAAGLGVRAKDAVGLLVDVTVQAAGAGRLRSALVRGGLGVPLADYAPGGTMTDLAVVSSSGGRFGLLNDATGAAVVSATVVGYVARTAAAAGGSLVAVAPAPVRPAPIRVAAGGTVSVPVAGNGGVPQAGVMAAAIGITAAPAIGYTGLRSESLSVGG